MQSSAQPGDEVAEFSGTGKYKITLLAIPNAQLVTLVHEKMGKFIPKDRKLVGVDTKNLICRVESYDPANKQAIISIQAAAKTIIKSTHSILDKSKLVGLSAKGAQLYLSSFDEIESVEVYFTPFWVKKVPKKLSRIILQIE